MVIWWTSIKCFCSTELRAVEMSTKILPALLSCTGYSSNSDSGNANAFVGPGWTCIFFWPMWLIFIIFFQISGLLYCYYLLCWDIYSLVCLDQGFSRIKVCQSLGDLVKLIDSSSVGLGWCLKFCFFHALKYCCCCYIASQSEPWLLHPLLKGFCSS